ncbi:hypothetical protein QWZ13_13560 [Reinekea marina]|nr:hypothetical protein [Reinekea marina]MDN3649942.1 hypothetical protein [Reinekea marina]
MDTNRLGALRAIRKNYYSNEIVFITTKVLNDAESFLLTAYLYYV